MNKTRNKVAHSLEHTLSPEDVKTMAEFIAENPKNSAQSTSSDPLAILVEFTVEACAVLSLLSATKISLRESKEIKPENILTEAFKLQMEESESD